MIQDPATHVFVAGMKAMLDMVEKALVRIAGSEEEWHRTKTGLVSSGRWSEILY
ncbi:MAG: hypothetical protein MZW92_15525 [Comamonadaceae bacterium]|nr:hypothetical protein [Comamonadaceae bacterium]